MTAIQLQMKKGGASIGLYSVLTGRFVMPNVRRRTDLYSTLSLHDERHEHPLLFPVPSPDDVLPSILDSDYDESLAELPATSTGFLVQSRLPNWADGFSRQGQAIRLLYMVLNLVREPFDRCPDLMLSRIEHLDSLIVTALGNLLADCNGKATQYCE